MVPIPSTIAFSQDKIYEGPIIFECDDAVSELLLELQRAYVVCQIIEQVALGTCICSHCQITGVTSGVSIVETLGLFCICLYR